MNKINVLTPGVRPKFEEWIKFNEGVKIWRNINLSNCGAGPIFTPAMKVTIDPMGEGIVLRSPYPKPSWQVDNGEVVTDINRFRFVKGFKELKRIRAFVRHGDGLDYCLTDSCQRRLDDHLERFRERYGGDVFYRKDGGLFDIGREIVIELAEWEDE
jgi:hypothetical protein